MGLYLCIFDGNRELDGVEVGSYADFNFFRDAVVVAVEGGERGSMCPVLTTHHDSDGEWSPVEAKALLDELVLIESVLSRESPVEFNSVWKKGVAKMAGISPRCLLDCFFDVDGEPLIERLRELAETSVRSNCPILFQ
jgi:hypothetical protein